MTATLTRPEVIDLLTRHRGATTLPSDATIDAWQTALTGHTAADCHAALLGLGPAARTATPSEIVGRIEALQDRTITVDEPAEIGQPARLSPRTTTVEREACRQAGMRGIQAVYAAMGWKRNADHDLARSVPCPFCKAKTWVVCGPLSRNRAGKREMRDPVHRMHPSRLTRAQAQLALHATATDREPSR